MRESAEDMDITYEEGRENTLNIASQTKRRKADEYDLDFFPSASSSPSPSAPPTAAAETTIKRVLTAKTTVAAVWKPTHTSDLHRLVDKTNTLVTHTFAFLKHVFVAELNEGRKFELSEYIRKMDREKLKF
ncbi:hypothetical protein HPULCUR_007879 [Helicostylum pulchrum]|uniref:Uncharacterized protein n=1 Tax=Helicostylum pulchrum TaxID=562976 RepID=A0ABP9Y617_9FUNG